MSKQLVKHVKHRRHHLRRGVVRQIRAQLRVRVPHAGVFCLFALKGRGVLGDGVVGEVSVCVCGAGVVVIADAEAHVRVEEEPRAERLPPRYGSAYVSIRYRSAYFSIRYRSAYVSIRYRSERLPPRYGSAYVSIRYRSA